MAPSVDPLGSPRHVDKASPRSTTSRDVRDSHAEFRDMVQETLRKAINELRETLQKTVSKEMQRFPGHARGDARDTAPLEAIKCASFGSGSGLSGSSSGVKPLIPRGIGAAMFTALEDQLSLPGDLDELVRPMRRALPQDEDELPRVSGEATASNGLARKRVSKTKMTPRGTAVSGGPPGDEEPPAPVKSNSFSRWRSGRSGRKSPDTQVQEFDSGDSSYFEADDLFDAQIKSPPHSCRVASPFPDGHRISPAQSPGGSEHHGIVVEPAVRTTKVACPGAARLLASRVVENPAFQVATALLVVANAIVTGILSDESLRRARDEDPPAIARAAELVLCATFALELCLRIYVYGLGHFTSDKEWRWNMVDALATVLQVANDLAQAAARSPTPTAGINFGLLRLCRLPRTLHTARLLRFVSHFQELRTMVSAISHSFKSLLWTCMILFLLIYIMGVYLTNVIALYARRHPEVLQEHNGIREFYGSLLLSVLTLFQATTGGVDWRDILKPLISDISPLLAIPFCLYFAFAVLAVMNVITGVFVESSLSTAQNSKDIEIRSQMCELFFRTDTDNSGKISWSEFSSHLQDPEMIHCFKMLNIDLSEAKGLFTLLDTDSSGEIDAEEFVMGCLRLQGTAKAIDLATLMYFNKRMATWWQDQVRAIRSGLADIAETLREMEHPPTPDLPEKAVPREDCMSQVTSQVPSQVPSRQRSRANSQIITTRRPPLGGEHAGEDHPENEESSLAAFATWAGLQSRHGRVSTVQNDVTETSGAIVHSGSMASVGSEQRSQFRTMSLQGVKGEGRRTSTMRNLYMSNHSERASDGAE